MTTLEQLNAKLKYNPEKDNEWRELRERIECENGLSLSIQASRTHYCTPRDDHGPYTKVELGFPSEDLTELKEYAEDPEDLQGTVYGHVPIEKVVQIIDEHGGIKSD